MLGKGVKTLIVAVTAGIFVCVADEGTAPALIDGFDVLSARHNIAAANLTIHQQATRQLSELTSTARADIPLPDPPSGDKILDLIKDIVDAAADAAKEPARRRTFVQSIKFRLHNSYPDYNVALCDMAQRCSLTAFGGPTIQVVNEAIVDPGPKTQSQDRPVYNEAKYGKDAKYAVWVFKAGQADFCEELGEELRSTLDGGLFDWFPKDGGKIVRFYRTSYDSLPDVGYGKGIRKHNDGCLVNFDMPEKQLLDPGSIDLGNSWGKITCDTTDGSPLYDDLTNVVNAAYNKLPAPNVDGKFEEAFCKVDNCCGSHCNEVVKFGNSRISVCGSLGRKEQCRAVAELAETLQLCCRHTFADGQKAGGRFVRGSGDFRVEISTN